MLNCFINSRRCFRINHARSRTLREQSPTVSMYVQAASVPNSKVNSRTLNSLSDNQVLLIQKVIKYLNNDI